ncbi:DUF4267 domain-containing protein [Streptomyces sp. 2131.1]|uniref:DUF4267 domain-containing protein n=1 Tax=Streptomyces sp. 2131.1 TaxID=1855346 RepID=UPI00210BB27B|nr:DUF4267 domain-containing protein [Streptomyces sp. 2131.1]
MGVRDIGTGLILGVLLIGATTHLLGWVMLAAALIPAGDAAVVARSKGSHAAIYGVHLGTAAIMVIIAALLVAA